MERSACYCLTALAPERSLPWQTLILLALTPGTDFPRLIVVLPSVLLTLGSWPRVLRWPESRLPLVSPDPGSSAIRAPVHLLGSLARGAGCSILLPLDVPCFRRLGGCWPGGFWPLTGLLPRCLSSLLVLGALVPPRLPTTKGERLSHHHPSLGPLLGEDGPHGATQVAFSVVAIPSLLVCGSP